MLDLTLAREILRSGKRAQEAVVVETTVEGFLILLRLGCRARTTHHFNSGEDQSTNYPNSRRRRQADVIHLDEDVPFLIRDSGENTPREYAPVGPRTDG